jgi:hypothetical protein
VLNGTIKLAFGAHGIASIEPDLALTDFAFADKEGLRAGEKIALSLRGRVDPRGSGWRWNVDLAWKAGEIFWQPLYFASAGNHLVATGSSDDIALRVEKGTLQLGSTGTLELTGVFDMKSKAVPDFTLRGEGLDLASLYPLLLKPFLAQSAGGQLDTTGRIDVDWRRRAGVTRVFDLGMHDVNLADANKRFAVKGVNARIPWVNEHASDGVIEIASAELFQLPIGSVVARPRMNGFAFTVPELSIPLLDGRLNLEDVRAAQKGEEWTWTLKGGLTPLSLPALTEALHLPRMAGTLSGVIPQVSYTKDQVKVDGALLFRIFDGSIVVKDLTLSAPFGLAPRLHADLSMRNLDLDLLTQTYSFGKMQGRIDTDVRDLELENWKPVKFDARLASSPGDYPKKISQQAVQNISSLGGAGAAAAIQRSLLRVFEQFGYSKIGLTCALRNNICVMGGVEDTPQGYVIVKGGGIPAITVLGYNRVVGWEELLTRLARVTQGNSKPIIR